MTPLSAPVPAAGSIGQSHGAERERLSVAARQFEAIFLRQMLSAARKADFGTPLLGGRGLDTFRTMQDEHFAALASQSGAFGLAAQIEAQLARFVDKGS
jgi:flagellar protein FlgJ